MTIAFIFIGVAVLALIALVAVGYGEGLPERSDTVAPAVLPPANQLHATDVDTVAFPVTVRGYRMADVDAVLDHLTQALRHKEQQLAVLATESKRQAQLQHQQARLATSTPVTPEPTPDAPTEPGPGQESEKPAESKPSSAGQDSQNHHN